MGKLQNKGLHNFNSSPKYFGDQIMEEILWGTSESHGDLRNAYKILARKSEIWILGVEGGS
jgi:hypothetical protein